MCFEFYTEIQDGRESDFLQNVANTVCRYRVGIKFCRNCSILHRFQDKCTFVFYTEIQNAAKSGGKVIFAKSHQ